MEPLVGSLSATNRTAIELESINPDSLAKLISVEGANSLSIPFTSTEQEAILRAWYKYPDLLKAMPLHNNIRGGLSRISGNCFWEGDYKYDGPLIKQFTLLKLSKDQDLAFHQKKLTPVLEPKHILEFALNSGGAQYWEDLLSALAQCESMPSAMKEKLLATKWIPMAQANFVSPQQLLLYNDLPLEKEISRIIDKCNGWFSVKHLHSTFREHKAYSDFVRHFFQDKNDLASRLVKAISTGDHCLGIGNLGSIFDMKKSVNIKEWLKVFQGAPDDVMLVSGMVDSIFKIDENLCSQRFLSFIEGSKLRAKRLEQILHHLQESHIRQPNSNTLAIHNAYLSLWAKNGTSAREALAQLKLLNEAGKWVEPRSLCAGETGLDRTKTLNLIQAEILADIITFTNQYPTTPDGINKNEFLPIHATDPRLPSALSKSVNTLREYFEPWREHSVELSTWAGAFLSLLGDYGPLKELAREFLPRNIDIDYVRAQIGIKGPSDYIPGFYSKHIESKEMFELKKFIVVVYDQSKPLTVSNLLGEPFVINLDADFPQNCLLHDFKHVLNRISQPTSLKLINLNINNCDISKIHTLLANTGDLIIQFIYGSQYDFKNVLEILSKSDNLKIEEVQCAFLNGATFFLRQLGLNQTSNILLKDILNKFELVEEKKAKEDAIKRRGFKGDSMFLGELNQITEFDARNRLKNLIQTDIVVQEEISQAMCKKLRDYGYDKQSIPFEIFQNADDAYVEITSLNCPAVFAIAIGKTTYKTIPIPNGTSLAPNTAKILVSPYISFMHSGRCINQEGIQKKVEFYNDLYKMMSLNHSDKLQAGQNFQTNSQKVTGRFGLGFKSIYLICDQPMIISGRIGFKVLGSVYPRTLSKADDDSLRFLLKSGDFQEKKSTSFTLPLRSDIKVSEVIDSFQSLIYLLVVFAQRIRCVKWKSLEDSTFKPTVWKESLLCSQGQTRVLFGTLEPHQPRINDPQKAIVFRSEVGDILFGLNQGKFVMFPESVPTLWATAPAMEECHHYGWLVNSAEFKLDMGRRQMNWSGVENKSPIEGLGQRLAEGLISLFEFANTPNGWQEMSKSLDCNSNDSYSFWESFWHVISPLKNGPALLEQMHWDSHFGGLFGFYQKCPALPTGIALDHHRCLTHISHIQAVLDDELATGDHSRLKKIFELPSFQKIRAGTLILSSIYERLKKLMPNFLPAGVVRVDLKYLLQKELDNDENFTQVRAKLFAQVVPDSAINDCRPILNRARIQSRTGCWELPHRLLLGKCPQGEETDEVRTAQFAPPEMVLGDDYDEEAVRFIQGFRVYQPPKIECMAEWAKMATTPVVHQLVLVYQNKGERGYQLQNELGRLGTKGTWLENLGTKELEDAGYDNRQQLATFATLGIQTPTQPFLEKLTSPPSWGLAETSLAKITQWWKENSPTYLQKYNQSYVPNGTMVDQINMGDDKSNTGENRSAWLRLFASGSLWSLGLVNRNQNRKFLKICDTLGAFETLLNPEKGSKQWLTRVQSYLDKQEQDIQYYHWFRHSFLGVVYMARHLDHFIYSFRAIDRLPSTLPMRHIETPRINHYLSGTGIDAPPLGPVLGIGACAVLRELVRGKIIQSRQQYCYPPVKRVRNLLKGLGWQESTNSSPDKWEQSQSIYKFLSDHLEDPTFGHCFDLPLLALADDAELKTKILGY